MLDEVSSLDGMLANIRYRRKKNIDQYDSDFI